MVTNSVNAYFPRLTHYFLPSNSRLAATCGKKKAVQGLAAMLILLSIYSYRKENELLHSVGASSEIRKENTGGDGASNTAAKYPTSPSTSWKIGLSELKREAPNLGKWQSPEARAVAEPLLPAWILDMGAQHEGRIFSQWGEDGITDYILSNLPYPATLKTYVEFGVETGVECNTRFLREMRNWSGLMLDGGTERPEIGLYQEMIHPDNIVSLFEKYGVEKKFGLFSEDTDYADFFIWRNILDAGYRPRILISEHNSNLFADESVTVHDPGRDVRIWAHTDYFGVSALALRRLWNKHGYIMVYCTSKQINCFGLHQDDILRSKDRNPAGVKAAQEALWAKPLAWPVKLHGCNLGSETWNYVDENGDLAEGAEFTPRVMQHCCEQAALKETNFCISLPTVSEEATFA
jgi:hypothetical protein